MKKQVISDPGAFKVFCFKVGNVSTILQGLTIVFQKIVRMQKCKTLGYIILCYYFIVY